MMTKKHLSTTCSTGYLKGEEPWLGLLTGVMGALLRRSPALARAEDLELLSSLLKTCPYYEVRVNAAAMLGLAGAQQVEAVGRVLIEALAGETNVMTEAAILDAVMDVFGEDETDGVFVQLKLLDVLKEVLPKVRRKNIAHRFHLSGSSNLCPMDTCVCDVGGDVQFRVKVKTEASKYGKEALAHVKETALNVSRFIKYKMSYSRK